MTVEMIRRVDHTKPVGLTIDDRLFWSNHIDEICRKASSAIGASKQIRHFISANTAPQIYNAFMILPHFDYYNPVWDCLIGQSRDKLQKLHHAWIQKDLLDFSPNVPPEEIERYVIL